MDEEIEVVYRAGYFIPTERHGQFDIQRDNALIENGSHFFCQGHLGAVVTEEQSRNPKYCCDCYKAIRELV